MMVIRMMIKTIRVVLMIVTDWGEKYITLRCFP